MRGVGERRKRGVERKKRGKWRSKGKTRERGWKQQQQQQQHQEIEKIPPFLGQYPREGREGVSLSGEVGQGSPFV